MAAESATESAIDTYLPPPRSAKEIVARLVESLPAESTWDQLLTAILDRRRLEEGFDDIREGRTVSHEEVFREFGL